MPSLAHKHRQCAQNGIVFPFQVGMLKFYACIVVTFLVFLRVGILAHSLLHQDSN